TRRQAQPYWRTIVEDVERVSVEQQGIGKSLDHIGKAVERVVKRPTWRRLGLSEAGQVWCDEPKAVSQQGNQVAEHMAGTREAVQQQDDRGVARPRFTVEDVDVTDSSKPIASFHRCRIKYLGHCFILQFKCRQRRLRCLS